MANNKTVPVQAILERRVIKNNEIMTDPNPAPIRPMEIRVTRSFEL